jgi:hypothetical protein
VIVQLPSYTCICDLTLLFLSCDHGFTGAIQHVSTGDRSRTAAEGDHPHRDEGAAKALIGAQLLEQPDVPGRRHAPSRRASIGPVTSG